MLKQFEDTPHGEGHAFRRLQNKSISTSDGVGQEPERDHARKIEWHDCGDHSKRLPDHGLIDSARHVFEVVALHHHRDAAGDFDVLDRAPQLGFSFSESLPVFLRDDPAQFVKVILKKLLQLEERLNAVFRWRAAPFRPCRCGCFNGTGYFSGA